MIAAAAVATGKPFKDAQYLAEQAADKLRELKPNVLNLYKSSGTAASTVLQGEAYYGAISASKWVHPYTQKGAPIDMTYPKEGGFFGINTAVRPRSDPAGATCNMLRSATLPLRQSRAKPATLLQKEKEIHEKRTAKTPRMAIWR